MQSFRHAVASVLRSGAVAAGLLLAAGCSQPPAPPAPPAVEVVSASPVKLSIVEWDEYVGRLDPIDFVEVRARVSGYLDSTNFEEGQIVKRGDLLCVIDPRPFEAEVRRSQAEVNRAQSLVRQAKATVGQVEAEIQEAQAKLDLANKQHERSRRLAQQNALPQDQFDVTEAEVSKTEANLRAVQARLTLSNTQVASAESDVASAQAALAIAELNLEYTQVKAPITGRVSSRHVTEGNLISGGQSQSTLITTIVSLDPIHCHFDADENSYLKYERLAKEGKLGSSRDVKHPVYVGLGDEPNASPHPGHMDFVDNRLDPETGTMRCRAILANPDLSLTPGLFTRVRLPGSGRHESILIPDFTVSTDQSEKYVFVVEADGKVRRQVIELGPIVQGLRVIRKGLDGSEKIVLRGQQRVRPGITVVSKDEAIEPVQDGLPTDSEPVPKDKWLSRPEREPRPPFSATSAPPIAEVIETRN